MLLSFKVQAQRGLERFGLLASVLILGTSSAIVNLALPAQSAITLRPRPESKPSHQTIAQFFYPPADPNPVLRVIGKGYAKLPADFAELTFEFGAPEEDVTPTAPAEPSAFSNHRMNHRMAAFSKRRIAATPVPESALQSILKALLAIGIPNAQIRLSAEGVPPAKSPLPFPLPFPSKSSIPEPKIWVKQDQPTQAALSKIVSTVRSAAALKKDISLTRVGVNYTLKDCKSLETAVYQSAVQNAQNRAMAIATAMNATLNPVPSVAQPVYDLFFQSCGDEGRSFALNSSTEYNPSAAPEVLLSREIFVTYTLKH
jgi:uncharacterized protein YggE